MTAAAWVPPWLEPVWGQLEGARHVDRLPHAILLEGPPGWGKKFLARQFARALVGASPRSPSLMAYGDEAADGDLLAHRDVRLVGRTVADSGRLRRQILIDQVRELGEFLRRTAGAGGLRVAIIELAEDLNVNAANALLKCLEEPGAGCHLLLLSEHASKVLPTIRSRCQRLKVPPGTRDAARDWLRHQLPPDVDAERMLELVGGAPLRARESAGGDLPDMADAVDAFLAGGPPDPLIGQDRERAELLLELLYRGLAARVRAGPPGRRAHLLRFIDRVSRARRLLLSQSNPNVVLLLEDLLLGHRAG